MSDAGAGVGPQTALSFTKLCVTELARSRDFYTRVLGMKEIGGFQREDLHEVFLKFSDSPAEATLVLMQWIPDRAVVVGFEHGRLGIVTSDLDGLVGRVRKAGFPVTEEPHEMADQGIRLGFVADPDGYAIEIVQVLPAGASGARA